MKPTIGVIPLWDDAKQSIWMLPAYLEAIEAAGGVAVTLPLSASSEDVLQLCGLCDGFLLTGGHDVDPALYGAEVSNECGTINFDRDKLERTVFDYAVAHDKPLLGICRGIQFINALCGGTLYQDLPTEHTVPNAVSHQMVAPYDRSWHSVTIIEGTPLAKITTTKELGVNSYHHQAIKELAPNLQPMAISEDGLIEAIYMPTKRFMQALQWHPELDFRSNEVSLRIVREFIGAC